MLFKLIIWVSILWSLVYWYNVTNFLTSDVNTCCKREGRPGPRGPLKKAKNASGWSTWSTTWQRDQFITSVCRIYGAQRDCFPNLVFLDPTCCVRDSSPICPKMANRTIPGLIHLKKHNGLFPGAIFILSYRLGNVCKILWTLKSCQLNKCINRNRILVLVWSPRLSGNWQWIVSFEDDWSLASIFAPSDNFFIVSKVLFLP